MNLLLGGVNIEYLTVEDFLFVINLICFMVSMKKSPRSLCSWSSYSQKKRSYNYEVHKESQLCFIRASLADFWVVINKDGFFPKLLLLGIEFFFL